MLSLHFLKIIVDAVNKNPKRTFYALYEQSPPFIYSKHPASHISLHLVRKKAWSYWITAYDLSCADFLFCTSTKSSFPSFTEPVSKDNDHYAFHHILCRHVLEHILHDHTVIPLSKITNTGELHIAIIHLIFVGYILYTRSTTLSYNDF